LQFDMDVEQRRARLHAARQTEGIASNEPHPQACVFLHRQPSGGIISAAACAG
jgi:hypothetical protein